MNHQDLINYFGSEMKTAAYLDMSHTAVRNWTNIPIPRLTQLAIQTLTKNKLLADENIIDTLKNLKK